MDDVLSVRLRANGGVVTAEDLQVLGYGSGDTRMLVRHAVIRRVRRGAYVDAARYDSADAVGQHVLTVRAVLSTLAGYAACDLSAVALWGLPVLASSIGRVHAAQVGGGRARTASGVSVHPPVSISVVRSHEGVAIVDCALAVAQVSGRSTRDGLIAADAALRARRCTRDALCQAADLLPSRGAERVAGLASALSESPGESLCRLVFAGLGIEQPEQQAEIHDEHGWLVGRVDFLFRAQKVVVEFDGAVKYAGADGREALMREKRREDALRARGYRVVRLTWADLAEPERVRRMLEIALGA